MAFLLFRRFTPEKGGNRMWEGRGRFDEKRGEKERASARTGEGGAALRCERSRGSLCFAACRILKGFKGATYTHT